MRNITTTIFSTGLLSTGMLVAGCAVDTGEGMASSTTEEVGQPIVRYDAETSTYHFESGELDLAGYPWTVEVENEMRGSLDSPDDVLEVKGVAQDAEVRILASEEQEPAPVEQLESGESVELDGCYAWGAMSYCCAYTQYCPPTSAQGPCVTYCSAMCLQWTCYGYS